MTSTKEEAIKKITELINDGVVRPADAVSSVVSELVCNKLVVEGQSDQEKSQVIMDAVNEVLCGGKEEFDMENALLAISAIRKALTLMLITKHARLEKENGRRN